MQWLIRYYSDMEMNMNSVERVKEYLEIEQEAPAIVDGKQPPAAVSVALIEWVWLLVRWVWLFPVAHQRSNPSSQSGGALHTQLAARAQPADIQRFAW